MILHPAEIFDHIFSLHIEEPNIPANVSDEIRYLIENTKYPKFSVNELRAIIKELKKDPFCQVLRRHNYVFPLQPHSLESIAKNENDFELVFDVLAIYTFHAWISINLLFMKGEGCGALTTLLTILNNIITKAMIMKKNKIYLVAASCFVNLIQNVVNENLEIEYVELFPIITDLFLNNVSLPQGTDEIIDIISRKFFSQASSINFLGEAFLNSLTIIMQKNPHNINSKIIMGILEKINNSIIHLDQHSLTLLLSSLDIVPVDFIQEIIEPIMLQLFSLLYDDKRKLGPYENKTSNRYFVDVSKPISDFFHPPKDIYYLDKINDFSLSLPERIRFRDLIHGNLYAKITIIKEIILYREEYTSIFILCVNNLINKVLIDDNSLIYNQYAIIFRFLSSIAKKYTIFIPSFFNSVLFNPSITLFTPCKNFEEINTLRDVAFMFSLNDQGVLLRQALNDACSYPYLFREYVYRLILHHNELPKNYIYFSESLMFPFVLYRNIFDGVNEPCQLARKTILLFFNVYLGKIEKIKKLFSLSIFSECFFILLFEPPVRRQFMSTFLKYLLTINRKNKIISDYIIQLIGVSCTEMEVNDAIFLLIDLFNALNEAALFNNEVSYLSEPTIPKICQNILSLPEMERSDDLLMSVITFLATTSRDKTLKANELYLIESAIIHLSITKSPNKIIDKLAQVIAGKNMAVCIPAFEIKQSKLLCSFLRIFMETEYILVVIEFITKLCMYSTDNCIKCHESEVDILILEKIDQWRHSDELADDVKVEAFLNLFTRIASIVSSVIVVRRFFSMLCPIETRYLSSIHQNILNALNTIFITSKKFPQGALPLLPDNSLKLTNIPSKCLLLGISFSFWISMAENPTSYMQNLILMDDGRKHSVKISIIGTNFKVKIQSGQDYYNGDFEIITPLKTWTMITVNISQTPETQESSITIYVNDQPRKSISKFAPFRPRTTYIDSILNYPSKKSSTTNNPPYIGLFMLMKLLQNEDIISLYNEGPRPTLSSRYGIIFAYVPQDLGHHFTFQPISKLDSIVESHSPIISNKKCISFFDLFLNFCKITILLPIFGQLDIPNKNGYFLKYLGEQGVEILSNLFSLGTPPQISFYKSKGFHTIAHLLVYSEGNHATFNLYSKYFNLLGNISHKKLQVQLIDSILMNINIWAGSDRKNKARIIKHWSKTLYPSFKPIIDKIRPFNWILNVLHIHFIPLKPNDIEIYECRKSLLDIAYVSFKYKLTPNIITSIIGFICSKNLEKAYLIEKIEMIELLTSILECRENVSPLMIKMSEIIPFIYKVFDLNNNTLTFLAIRCIITAHKQKYEIQISLASQVEKILIKVQDQSFDDTIFHQLIDLMNFNTPELLPIVCWIAIKKGEDSILYFRKKDKFQQFYYVAESSPFYACMMLFRVPKHYISIIVPFIITGFKNNWDKVLFSINILGRAISNSEHTDLICHNILLEMARYPRYSRETAFKLIRMIKNFIFFRPVKSNCSILNSFMPRIESIYKDDNENEDTISENSKNNRYDSISNIDNSFSEFNAMFDDNSSESLCVDRIDTHIGSPLGLSFTPGLSVPEANPLGRNKIYTRNVGSPRSLKYGINTIEGFHSISNSDDFRDRKNLEIRFADEHNNLIGYNRYEEYSDSILFDENNADKESEDHNNLFFAKLSIQNLQNMIINSIESENDVKYGMRFNDQGQWLDSDLATTVFSIYRIHCIMQYSEVIYVMAYFVNKTNPKFIAQEQHTLNMANQVVRKEIQMLLETPMTLKTYVNAEYILMNRDEMYIFESTGLAKTFLSRISTIPYNVDKKKLDELHSASRENYQIYNEKNEKQMKIYMKYWSRTWHSLTIPRAPWEDSLPDKVEGFKRDKAFCDMLCPFKVRCKSHIDKHMRASILRDTGDSEYTIRKLSAMTKDTPSSLLFCASSKEQGKVEESDQKFVRIEVAEHLHCQLVTIKEVLPAIIKLNLNSIAIFTEKFEKEISGEDIMYLLYRSKNHRFAGFEVFTKYNESFFLVFTGNRFRTVIPRIRLMPSINTKFIQTLNYESFFRSFNFAKDWTDGKISNFQYLMLLNIFSGRSFNDASQYPIFPWILSDYTSKTLNLNDANTFRDLSKPIGAVNSQRLSELQRKMKELESIGEQSYLYGSGPSNPLSVYLWLVRLEPFTTQHIEVQGGRFDYASRIFRSISDSYLFASTNHNDYRELVPEFFFLPEFLKNMSNFDLGFTDEGKVSDVILPPWADGSPTKFIYLHRKAIESEYVSKHLDEWIDLMWGYKQRGEEALKANNIFRSEMYSDIWVKTPGALESPEVKQSIELVQSLIGQIPEQLFFEKHPKRNIIDTSTNLPPFSQNMPYIIKLEEITHLVTSIVYGSSQTTLLNRVIPTNQSNLTTKNQIITFRVLNQKGIVYTYEIDISQSKDHFIKAKHSKQIINNMDFDNNGITPTFLDYHRLCYADESGTCARIMKIESGSVDGLIHSDLDIVSLATHHDGWIGVGAKDAAVTLYNNYKATTQPVLSFRDSIKCICINPTFDSLICGTRDNWILFCSLNRGSVIRMVEVPGRPQRIIVTDSMGFVAVTITKINEGHIQDSIILYDISGEYIATTIMNKRVTAMTCISSADGFDYLIISDDEGNIYSFEAFYMNINEPIYKCNSQVIKIEYSKQESVIIIFCENGEVIFVYHPLCM
ncbi:hypothetical protein TRFO_09350 [Tritrichomonas foetus]|uniref:BEACH domain-containing protein n=1 Tax=Tritrichomonas foetus TaxID=1144522 RepID=A0A1J4JG46_9EUKA|nr:hypothetical protein TRFO_09350 [Tritrichomonas foetus]|eukprot:OHS97641.1 hypothetical protein TRFO_09350 [Tritrichomonas foetus]